MYQGQKDPPPPVPQARFSARVPLWMRRWFVTVGVGAIPLAFLTWLIWIAGVDHQSRNHGEKADRGEIIGAFQAVYGTLYFLEHLPFPTRRGPIVKHSSEINGKGPPFHSWRAELADYQFNWQILWDEYKPWDSPANRGLMYRDLYYPAVGTKPATKEAVERGDPFPDTVIMAFFVRAPPLEKER